MEENRTGSKPETIQVTLESTQYTLIAGASVEIVILLQNTGPWGDYFKVNLLGIPPGWITYSGQPAVWIAEGGKENVSITVHPPAVEATSGHYPARLYVFSQSAPENVKEQELLLIIQPVEKPKEAIQPPVTTDVKPGTGAVKSPERVGVSLKSVQFSTAPGSSVTIPFIVANGGLTADSFRLGVEGIPGSWVSTSHPVTLLEPGESKEISLVIRPPLAPSSQAGRYKFKINVASREAPDQVSKVDCILTVSAYTKFSTELDNLLILFQWLLLSL